MSASWFVGVDVGGTFTDVVLADTNGEVVVDKLPTTPEDPRVGVIEGIRRVLATSGVAAADVSRVVHGTTLATNVILEQKGGPIAFVVTEGFADLLRLGREARVEEDRYDLFFTTPTPPVEPRLTFEVSERVNSSGAITRTLGADDVEELTRRVAASNPTAVAVCFLNAYANPDHERVVGEALRAALPDTFVVTSSEVWPELREYERAMTTVMCAYVGPVMAGYLSGLEIQLRELGVAGPLEIMDSAGGVMSAAMAARRPVRTLESGGAAGVTAAGLVERLIGAPAVISFDMGGTTAKVGIVRDGKPAVTNDFQVGGKGSFGGTRAGTGFPVKIPTVDLAEVGAGGGSIAWVDPGGALRVGPQSAGSMPGPACYGRGGTEPTVTDANLLLGYLDPSGLAGGVTLSVDAADRGDHTRGRRPARHRRDRGGARDPRHRERQHGGRDPRRHRAARHRPTRLHARRVRRRGPDARGTARADVRDPLGRGAVRRRRRVGGRAHRRRPRCRARADPHRRPRGRGRVGDRSRVRGAHRAGPCRAGRRAGRDVRGHAFRRRALPRAGLPPHRAGARPRAHRGRTWSSSTPRSATSTTRRTASRSSTPRRSTTCGCT